MYCTSTFSQHRQLMRGNELQTCSFLSAPGVKSVGSPSVAVWRFPLLLAETATDGANLPPVAPIALGGGANWRNWGGANGAFQ